MPLGQAQGHGMRQLAPGSGPGWAAPENSGIRRFAGDYRLYDVDEEDQEFYEWIFGGYKPLEELPEHTSLQRAVKAHLATGGRLGMARGVLTHKAITENQGAMGGRI